MTLHLADTGHASWMTVGACRDEDPELFFPIGAGDAGADQTQRAVAVCGLCVARTECLRYALDNGVKHGIWGGRTEQERLAMLRSRRGHSRTGPGRGR
jgi:WhiB family transcriptional regulator, redox-sensing transcriptional regulator